MSARVLSNVRIVANVMVDEPSRMPALQWVPGELRAEMLHPWQRQKDIIVRYLTPRQMQEYENHLVCIRCGRRCVGSCSLYRLPRP